MSEHIKPQDYLLGALLSAGSSAVQSLPGIRDRVGGAEHPGYTPLRWRHARVHPSTIAHWTDVTGDYAAGKTPRKYNQAAVLLVSQADLDMAQHEFGGKHAVAYQLGTTVMVGLGPNGRFFGETDNNQNYELAMRLAQGPLRAAMGLWLPDHGKFYAPVPAEVAVVAPVAQLGNSTIIV